MPDVANAFAAEGFIDEIAHVMRENPLDTRLRMIGEPRQVLLPGGGTLDTGRLANVLKLAAERIQWKDWLRTVNGLGIASWYLDGAYVAHAIEVSMKGEQLTIERAVCVADVGRAINPKGLEGQLAGATLDALSQALNLAITIKDGKVQQHDWKDYALASMAQLPNTVEVDHRRRQRPPTHRRQLARHADRGTRPGQRRVPRHRRARAPAAADERAGADALTAPRRCRRPHASPAPERATRIDSRKHPHARSDGSSRPPRRSVPWRMPMPHRAGPAQLSCIGRQGHAAG